MLMHVWNLIRLKISALRNKRNPLLYWRVRAEMYGKRGVLNLAHKEEQFDVITEQQKTTLFPMLKKELHGAERTLLDFGCGTGRFSRDLAKLIRGSVTAVDVTRELLKLASTSPNVTYKLVDETLPFPDASFDVVWSCLVLGGLQDLQLKKSIDEIERVLRPGGLFFYVENTARVPNSEYWYYRDENTYKEVASFCDPKVLGQYEDLGQSITIFSGRKL